MCEPMEDTSGDSQESAAKPSYILRPGSMGEWLHSLGLLVQFSDENDTYCVSGAINSER